MANKKPTPSKIGTGTWMVLLGIAIFFDALQIIFAVGVIIGTFISLVASGTFWLIFKMNGEKYSKKTMIAGSVIGLIPLVNIIPEWSATIIRLYFNAKAKNTLAKVPGGNKIASTISGSKK
jgi:hypothetical protein